MAIGKAERDAMPDEWFAFPRTKQGPMPDEKHAKLAWDMLDRTKGVTEEERKAAPERVLKRARDLGVDTSGWHKLKAAGDLSFEVSTLSAMALDLPEIPDHPNRMPFSGVLTKLDQPSDKPTHGSLGKRVILPRDVAETALGSLLGMAVDYVPSLDGHDPKAKIGIITAAHIDGDDLCIEGFIYASDFPEEAALIKAKKDVLGFSFETAQNFVESLEGEFLVLAACTFTGAAILRKDKAAYETTSLAASAADIGDIDMTPEEMKALLASAVQEAVAPLNAEITALKGSLAASEETRAKVETHARALEACADGMEAAAVGGHAQNGHAAVLRRMAGSMRAEAAVGKIPHIWRDHDYPMYAGADTGKPGAPAIDPKVAELEAQMTKLQGELSAARAKSPEPERKTLSPQIQSILTKTGLALGEDGKLAASAVDQALTSLSVQERLRTKAALFQGGLLA